MGRESLARLGEQLLRLAEAPPAEAPAGARAATRAVDEALASLEAAP